jgi:hypothetical protein
MKIVVNCKIVEEVLGPFLGGILPSFLGSIFDPFFGQFSIADLLVSKGFLSVEGGFWAFFRRVFDRPFGHDFAYFGTSRCPLANRSLLPVG